MSFRRNKTAARRSHAWRTFLQANRTLLQESGVPISLRESRELFEDLLMHGCIDHHPDPTDFLVGQLSARQREALTQVIVRYLQAGFPDPGFVGFEGGQHARRCFGGSVGLQKK